MKLLLAAVAATLIAPGVAAAQSQPLRIAALSTVAEPCRPLEASATASERAYYDHLAKRLGAPILKCPVVSPAAAAAALAAGTLDMAVLDPAAYQAVQATTRPILTLRQQGGANRIPVALAVRGDDRRRSLAALRGASIIYGGKSLASLETPRKVLGERGAGPGFFSREVAASEPEEAIARLRGRQADAMALHAADWQRLCRKLSPKAPAPCGDLAVVLRARPRAERAIVVRRDMSADRRYRLIGIHMPLHIEAPQAFAWASAWQPRAAEFVPTEAAALTLANLGAK